MRLGDNKSEPISRQPIIRILHFFRSSLQCLHFAVSLKLAHVFRRLRLRCQISYRKSAVCSFRTKAGILTFPHKDRDWRFRTSYIWQYRALKVSWIQLSVRCCPKRAKCKVLLTDFVRKCQSRSSCGKIKIGNFVRKRQPTQKRRYL